MATIEGKHTIVVVCGYDSDELHKLVGRDPKTQPLDELQLKDIADTLTANLENVEEWDGCDIEPDDSGVFNDSYGDMIADLKDTYGPK